MEDGKNMFEKQAVGVSRTKEGKPPTRLQKHAPACLKLDQMKAAADNAWSSPFGPFAGSSSETATPIPLLTPLALSPNPFTETEDQFVFPTDDKKPATPTLTPTAFDWKQPAGAGYVEASTLFALFQNKCVLVNDAQ